MALTMVSYLRELSDQEQRTLVERARGQDPVEGPAALEALLDDFRGPALAAAHKTLAACGIDGPPERPGEPEEEPS